MSPCIELAPGTGGVAWFVPERVTRGEIQHRFIGVLIGFCPGGIVARVRDGDHEFGTLDGWQVLHFVQRVGGASLTTGRCAGENEAPDALCVPDG